MIKLVISGGDSFTYGSELPDDGNGPSKLSWANLIANKLDAKHINTADGGRSNSFIVRHVTNAVHEAIQHDYKPEDIFVQIMWTFPGRQEFAINVDTKRMDSPWFPLDPYVCEDESKSEWFKKLPKTSNDQWKTVHDDMHKRYLINKDLGLVDFAKEYYKVVSDTHDCYISLKNIFFIQNLLENKNIKYLFLYVNENVLIPLQYGDKFTKGLSSFIKWNNFFTFPLPKPMRNQIPKPKFTKLNRHRYFGFDSWAKANKYQYATSHPLELGHKDAADLIYERVKETIK